MPNRKPYDERCGPFAEPHLDCPHCGRKAARPAHVEWGAILSAAIPQGVHADSCPHSRASHKALDEEMEALAARRPFYPAKGVFMVCFANGVSKSGVNPGVPFVRSPKSRNAGGIPRGFLRLPTRRNPKTGVVLEWSVIAAARAAAVFLDDFGELGREQTIELGKNTIPIEGADAKAKLVRV